MIGKKRILWIDYTKTICIYFVLLGYIQHACLLLT